jgi:hypothetical protein
MFATLSFNTAVADEKNATVQSAPILQNLFEPPSLAARENVAAIYNPDNLKYFFYLSSTITTSPRQLLGPKSCHCSPVDSVIVSPFLVLAQLGAAVPLVPPLVV